MDYFQKIKLIREQMQLAGIDAYIVPSSDPHASEYLPDYYKTRAWLSGFTGSAGTMVVTQDIAALWTDGRYFIQAAKEIDGTDIVLYKLGEPLEPTLTAFLYEHLNEGDTVGFNGFQMMTKEAENISIALIDKNIHIDYTSNLIDKIWLCRPYLPCEKIIIHDVKFVGETSKDRIERVRGAVKNLGANCHLISKLDDIAWLLNLRGNDIPNNPYFLSYLFIREDDAILYVDPLKLNNRIIDHLHQAGVKVKLYEDLLLDLEELTCQHAICIDKAATPYHVYNVLKAKAKVIDRVNPTTLFKAIKNTTEIQHLKACYRNDGVAMVKTLYWIHKHIGKTHITECTVDEILTKHRKKLPHYYGKSFDTIAAYKDHGAIMHYKATEESAYVLEPKGLFLLDSGGQYHTGTTDVTRTLALGPLTDQEKSDYTLTLKAMMALSKTIFLENATGTHLDTVARMHMWAHEMDYKSGTGHGIGYFLGVHEGPQRISMHPSDAALMPGMVVTNEPGVYRAGQHGVRLENTLLVVPHTSNEFGHFFAFETLTKCPFDCNAIVKDMLTTEELLTLNTYHESVYQALHKDLTTDEQQWLREKTMPL